MSSPPEEPEETPIAIACALAALARERAESAHDIEALAQALLPLCGAIEVLAQEVQELQLPEMYRALLRMKRKGGST